MGEHHHHHEVSGKNLFLTIILNLIITVAQFVGGILSGSLALLSDAMHNFSDVLSLLIAFGAHKLSHKPSSLEKTFGYRRAEILATLFNASMLIAIAIYLIFESIHKLYAPEPIESLWVIALGLLGIIVNSLSVFIIKDDAKSNMNFKAAYLHLLADVMTSVAVVIGGVLMYYFNIFWIDSVISIIIALYLIWASWSLIKDSTSVLMQFVPEHLNIQEILNTITNHSKIKNVHHMHLWRLDDKRIHLEAHLDFNQNISLADTSEILDELECLLHDKFEIEHTTFQCEYERCNDKDVIKA